MLMTGFFLWHHPHVFLFPLIKLIKISPSRWRSSNTSDKDMYIYIYMWMFWYIFQYKYIYIYIHISLIYKRYIVHTDSLYFWTCQPTLTFEIISHESKNPGIGFGHRCLCATNLRDFRIRGQGISNRKWFGTLALDIDSFLSVTAGGGGSCGSCSERGCWKLFLLGV